MRSIGKERPLALVAAVLDDSGGVLGSQEAVLTASHDDESQKCGEVEEQLDERVADLVMRAQIIDFDDDRQAADETNQHPHMQAIR
jgi:hypothetical protein